MGTIRIWAAKAVKPDPKWDVPFAIKATVLTAAISLLAGCAVVPVVPYDAYDTYYSSPPYSVYGYYDYFGYGGTAAYHARPWHSFYGYHGYHKPPFHNNPRHGYGGPRHDRHHGGRVGSPAGPGHGRRSR